MYPTVSIPGYAECTGNCRPVWEPLLAHDSVDQKRSVSFAEQKFARMKIINDFSLGEAKLTEVSKARTLRPRQWGERTSRNTAAGDAIFHPAPINNSANARIEIKKKHKRRTRASTTRSVLIVDSADPGWIFSRRDLHSGVYPYYAIIARR